MRFFQNFNFLCYFCVLYNSLLATVIQNRIYEKENVAKQKFDFFSQINVGMLFYKTNTYCHKIQKFCQKKIQMYTILVM